MTPIARTAAAAIAATLLAAPALAQMNHSESGKDGMHSGMMKMMEGMEGTSKSYMEAMHKMHQAMMGMEMTGKPGVDFAVMMIAHHQSAIDMAKAYLETEDKDPDLVTLSNEIIAAQEKEIAFLKEWLAKNGQKPQ